MALTAGTRIGPYEVAAQIGVGGMGEVYRALDTNLGRQVAIKILPDTFAHDPERLARFEREAKTLAALNHPNIAQIYGLEKADGIRALVMELVEGPTLADRIAHGPVPVDEALPIAKQIAEALEAAHEQGIIHRDLKPANIKVRPDGAVKVLDFGLARALAQVGAGAASDIANSPTVTSPAMTQVGVLLGTAAYMSPEQARGKPVDKRADIWAFGCVLYEMLRGTRAFQAEDVSLTLAEVMKAEPNWKRLPPVPPLVGMFLRQCLKKDLRERAHDIGDVRLALEGGFDGTMPPTTARGSARRFVWPLVSMLLAVALLASLLFVWQRPSPPSAPTVLFVDQLPEGLQFWATGWSVLAIARDGSHVVYNSTRGLYLRSPDKLEAHLILGTEGRQATAPFFSADGQFIAYFSEQRLERIPITGGAPVVICPAAPSDASWAGDDTIFFAQADGIWRVPSSGESPPALVVRAKPGEVMDSPSLLPDRQTVLFTVTTAKGGARWDAADVAVQSLKSGVRKTLVPGGSAPRLAATGHLLYAVGTALYAAAFDLDRLKLGPAVSVVQGLTRAPNATTNGATAQYDVSTTGTLIYAAGGLGAKSLVWVDPQGREELVGARDDTYQQPRISPDGRRLAVSAGADIWVWTFASANAIRLTNDAATQYNPAWMDSQRIIFDSNDGTNIQVLRKSADGAGTADLFAKAPVGYPESVSPEGKFLIYHTRSRVLMLRSLVDGGPDRPLVNELGLNSDAEVSPDGRSVAYESNQSGRFEVYVRSFPNVETRREMVSSGGGQHPLWSRDGRELFYIAANGMLMSVAVGPGPTFSSGRPLFPAGQYYANVARGYDRKDDRFLFIKVGRPRANVVLNWQEELKQRVPTR